MMKALRENIDRDAPGAQVCERCGAVFRCGTLAGDEACWCATLPPLSADALRPGSGCLCPACLAAQLGRAARAD
ncbi:cysteine-rich CWC family protein [Caballeronia cordobensis]|uniref:cysteine-rich CWC family protein n=1 Tax=Caballeronia cordobensis TaxID=1353886 RepID=UPI00045EFE94|nr:uncharacterized protein BRPE67_ACDS00570 [Burkholderia sp. RPE67]BBP94938.1 hypothetical protein BSFA1_00670 [Burkholderia sp. SFA1]